MESNSGSPTDAAARLRDHESLRSKVEGRGPSRQLARMQVWSGAAIAVYLAVFLFSFGRPMDEVTSGGGYAANQLLLLPVLLFSGLITGARERFDIRIKPGILFWLAFGVILAGFMTLATLSILGVSYPWGLNLLVAVALFAAVGITPIRQLSAAPTPPESERWLNEPLSRPAQWSTALIGAVLGMLAATSALQFNAIFAAAILMVTLVVAAIGWIKPWGLARTGYEWGPLHWVAFGVAMSALYLLAFLISRTTAVTTPLAAALGLLAFLAMIAAALLPRPQVQEPS